jgi:hypothetical protein
MMKTKYEGVDGIPNKYRISHGLWLDMIFIQRVVFSIPEPWRGDRKHTTSWDKNHIQPQNTGYSFYNIYTCTNAYVFHLLWSVSTDQYCDPMKHPANVATCA